MKLLLPPLMLSATSVAASDHPRTFLASVIQVPLKTGESMASFSITTWGVEIKAICKIPRGWRIKGGNSSTPDGVLEGEGSQGATWFNRGSPSELRHIALITLYGPVQRTDVRNGPDATFKGTAIVSGEDGERKARLTYSNVKLTPASRCP